MEQLSPELITEILKAVSPKSMLKLCDLATAPNSWKAIASHEHYRRSELNLAISVRPTYKRQTRFLFTKRIRGTDDFNEPLTHLEVLQKYPEKSLSRVDIVDTDEMQLSLIPGVSATSDKWTRVNLNAKSEIFDLLRKNGIEKLLMDVRNETSLKAIRSLYEMFLSHGALVREFYFVVRFKRDTDPFDSMVEQREIDFFGAMTRLPNMKEVSFYLGLSNRSIQMLKKLVLELYRKWETNPATYKNFSLKINACLDSGLLTDSSFEDLFPNVIHSARGVYSRESTDSASGARMIFSIIHYYGFVNFNNLYTESYLLECQ